MTGTATVTMRPRGGKPARSAALGGFTRPDFESVREAFVENFAMGTRLDDPRHGALRRATYRSIGVTDPYAA